MRHGFRFAKRHALSTPASSFWSSAFHSSMRFCWTEEALEVDALAVSSARWRSLSFSRASDTISAAFLRFSSDLDCAGHAEQESGSHLPRSARASAELRGREFEK